MCWTCGCCDPGESHGDSRNITTEDLQSAADWAGTDLKGVLTNIVLTAQGCTPYAVTKVSRGTEAQDAYVQVIKSAEERRYTLGLAYPAMRPDSAVAADGHIDFVGEETLEKTAWEWMAKYRDVNLHHQNGTDGHATVVESYIYRGPNWTIRSPMDGKSYVIKSGDWLLGTVWDEYGWQLVKSGRINGWSPQGGARREVPTPERLAQLRSE